MLAGGGGGERACCGKRYPGEYMRAENELRRQRYRKGALYRWLSRESRVIYNTCARPCIQARHTRACVCVYEYVYLRIVFGPQEHGL